jgi:DNA-binding winged helix-turn-helix (wHTH) protein
MLVQLLEHAGELVSREQLTERLWNDQTNVEFNTGLHVAAAKLREALGETAARPKYFKTVSGKGYQFIAEVVPVLKDRPEPSPVAAPAPITETPALASTTPRFSLRTVLAPALILFLLCVLAATGWVV